MFQTPLLSGLISTAAVITWITTVAAPLGSVRSPSRPGGKCAEIPGVASTMWTTIRGQPPGKDPTPRGCKILPVGKESALRLELGTAIYQLS